MNQNINATRMELRKIRTKLKTAQKGHKLLKEKVAELIRSFYSLVQELKQMRMEVENLQKYVFHEYEMSKTRLSSAEINLLFSMPTHSFELDFLTDNFLGVDVPKIVLNENVLDTHLPYSPLSSTSQMDKTVGDFYALFPKIIKLAELEKKVYLLCLEIEKGKRRVNALENVLIPNYEQNIHEIENKLEENERASTARLMKVKTMLTKKD